MAPPMTMMNSSILYHIFLVLNSGIHDTIKMINDKFMVLNQLLIVVIDDGFMINGSF